MPASGAGQNWSMRMMRPESESFAAVRSPGVLGCRGSARMHTDETAVTAPSARSNTRNRVSSSCPTTACSRRRGPHRPKRARASLAGSAWAKHGAPAPGGWSTQLVVRLAVGDVRLVAGGIKNNAPPRKEFVQRL